MGSCFPLGWEGGSEERAGARLSVVSAPTELGWLEKNCSYHDPGKECICTRTCACKLACVYMYAPGKGSWVNWCVAGTEARGPSPQSTAGRKPVAGKELKLITRSGQVGRKKSPCSQGDLAQLSQQSALSMEFGAGMRLLGPIADIPGVLGFLGQLLKPGAYLGRGTQCPAASLGGLLPWLDCDSSHLRFLPQKARGTDPVQVLEGRGVSQAL